MRYCLLSAGKKIPKNLHKTCYNNQQLLTTKVRLLVLVICVCIHFVAFLTPTKKCNAVLIQ